MHKTDFLTVYTWTRIAVFCSLLFDDIFFQRVEIRFTTTEKAENNLITQWLGIAMFFNVKVRSYLVTYCKKQRKHFCTCLLSKIVSAVSCYFETLYRLKIFGYILYASQIMFFSYCGFINCWLRRCPLTFRMRWAMRKVWVTWGNLFWIWVWTKWLYRKQFVDQLQIVENAAPCLS